MSESDTASVECPLCGEPFDPTAAGGWCTNSDCGEWQYETDVTPDQQSTTEDDRATDQADSADESMTEAEKAAARIDEASGTAEDEVDGTSESQAADDTGDVAETDETVGDDTSAGSTDTDEAGSVDNAAAESAADDADEMESVEDQPSADDADQEAEDEQTFDCPGCGSSLAAEVNFCPDCGEDVSDLPGAEDGDELDACPSCDADVDAADSFCSECGQDLDAHRGPSATLDECPDCGNDVDEDDSFCAGCGADLDAHRSGAVDDDVDQTAETSESTSESADGKEAREPAPDALALSAHGKSVIVADGDTVGREIRSLLTDAGRPEDEAVRVHREHLRFVRESDQFYVVALGQNPTVLNARSLSKGDRERVGPGDELELSDVVTLDVEAA